MKALRWVRCHVLRRHKPIRKITEIRHLRSEFGSIMFEVGASAMYCKDCGTRCPG